LVYDSTGKLPAGVLDGNLAELGSFDECLYVTKLNEEPEGSSFTGQYCMGSIFVNATKNISAEIQFSEHLNSLAFSTCLPDACSATDVQNLFRGFGINLTTDDTYCQLLAERPVLDIGGIFGVTIFVCLALLMVASTIYDLRKKFREKQAPNALLSAFSVYTNLKNIFNTKSASKEITCLHGLRSIAIIVVIAFHRYFYSFAFKYRNKFYINHWVHQTQNMPLVKADFSMDVFFFLSGSMITYGFCQKMASQQRFRIMLHYVNRYMRLTPSMAIVALFVATVTKYLGSGPLWPDFNKNIIEPCVHRWWGNMLYIQTFTQPACLPQTWYAAADFQLFLLTPLLLIPLRRWPKKALVTTVFLDVCCVAFVFALAWIAEFRVAAQCNNLLVEMSIAKTLKIASIRNKEVDISLSKTAILKNFFTGPVPFAIAYYTLTPTRASPWLIGLIFGYFLHLTNNNPSPIRKPIAQRILFVALVICFAHVFGASAILNARYNKWISSIYLSLSPTAFVLSLAWIIYCCKLGYAGPINSFLSCSPFKIVSKLTYCMYLVQSPIIVYSIFTMRVPPFITGFEMTVHQIPGDLLYSFLIGLVLSLSVELPTQTFANALLKKL
ncbi:nose resistant to fluoxetine protein 6-like, partial [Photinus pyralis]|uniref:nose resistant to fluoxetine protein 6-like n=1 Tax=Photinus pyralis TaxID=7054 RepID=UPI0012674ABA